MGSVNYPQLILTIKDKWKKFKAPIKIEAWKYYEIVDILRSFGIGQVDSYEAAKWSAMARRNGETYTKLKDYILTIKEVPNE